MPPGLEVMRRFQGRAFFDLTAMQWAFYDAFGVLPAEVVKVLGGHQPQIPVPPGSPLKGPRGRRRGMAGLRLLCQVWNSPARSRAPIERVCSLSSAAWSRWIGPGFHVRI